MICNDCPRKCNIELNERQGFCGKFGDKIKIAKVMKHYWEEPIISGSKGSGAIFFSNCSLKCVFCQNYQISHLGNGKEFDLDGLIALIKKVDESDAENINFVTPTHYTTKILEAFNIYKPKKTVVWNTSGYEHNINRVKNFVDVFLFDFKYFDEELSYKYSNAKDYFSVCLKALKEARKIVPKDIIKDGIMKKGIIIRHLVLPNNYNDSIKIFEKIKQELGTDFYISLMSQYVPMFKAKDDKDLNRTLKPLEYKKVVNKVIDFGFNRGFLQDSSSAKCDYTPLFDEDKFSLDIDKIG